MFLSDALLPERRMHSAESTSLLWQPVPVGSGGRCRVWLKRRLVLGPDLWLTFLSYTSLILFSLYLKSIEQDISSTRWMLPVLGVLAFIIIALMMITGSMNPGIVARVDEGVCESLAVHFPSRVDESGLPYPRYLTINGVSVKQKWCRTCCSYRPPRSNHCKVCDNCVLRFDHHCAFLGCCVGINNYRWFITLILAISLFSVLSLAVVADKVLIDGWVMEDWSALLLSLGSSLAFTVLCGYHLFITGKNLTTNEHVKRYYKTNPFDYGCINNYRHVLFRPHDLLPIDEAPRISTSYSKPPLYNSDCLSDMYG